MSSRHYEPSLKGTGSRTMNYYLSDIPCQPSTEPRCGTANRMERIVGGQNTSTKRWPWIVYLTIFRYESEKLFIQIPSGA